MIVTAAATESDGTVIAAATGTAAAAVPQMPRGHPAVTLAVIGAVGAEARAETVRTGPRAAIETETITAVDATGDRALDPQADVSIGLESAMIDGIIENAESAGMTTAIAVAAGRLARRKMPATPLRRNSPRTRGTAGPCSSSSLPQD